jgi:acetyltransferase
MVRSIRSSRLLEGMRGEEAVDTEGLVEVIQRVSQLVFEHPTVAELDINPLLAFPEGTLAVDGRVALRRDSSPDDGAA